MMAMILGTKGECDLLQPASKAWTSRYARTAGRPSQRRLPAREGQQHGPQGELDDIKGVGRGHELMPNSPYRPSSSSSPSSPIIVAAIVRLRRTSMPGSMRTLSPFSRRQRHPSEMSLTSLTDALDFAVGGGDLLADQRPSPGSAPRPAEMLSSLALICTDCSTWREPRQLRDVFRGFHRAGRVLVLHFGDEQPQEGPSRSHHFGLGGGAR